MKIPWLLVDRAPWEGRTKVFHLVGNQWNNQLGYFSPNPLEFTIWNLDHTLFSSMSSVSVQYLTQQAQSQWAEMSQWLPKREIFKLICYYSIILSTGLLSPSNYSCHTVKYIEFAMTGLAVCCYCGTEAIKLLKYSSNILKIFHN